MAPTRILYVVTEDWYFLSHRLPMARAAKAAGYEIHVATRLNNGKAAIEAEGFIPHALSWQRGSLSPAHSISGVAELRRLLREISPDILHNISLKPVLLGGIASLGLSPIAVVNSLTGLGTLFVGNHRKSELTRPLVVAALKALLKRAGSRTIVQNPDDRRFVLGLGVLEGSVDLIPGSGVDTRTFRAAARAAASHHRGLCRAHARRQGRDHADPGLFARHLARGETSASARRRYRPRKSRIARAGAASRIRLRLRHSLARPCRRYPRGVGEGPHSPCSPRGARVCRRACSRQLPAAGRWSRPTRRAAARSPSATRRR